MVRALAPLLALLVMVLALAAPEPAAAQERLSGTVHAGEASHLEIESVSTASWNSAMVRPAGHATAWIRVALVGGSTVDYAIQGCTWQSGSAVCAALSPAVAGTVAAGASAWVRLDSPPPYFRVVITSSTGAVSVAVDLLP